MSDAGSGGSRASVGDSAGSEEPAAEGSRLRRYLIRGGVALVLLVAAGWVAAVTGFGMGTAVPYALDRFSPEGWTVRVGTAEGSWLDRVEVTDVAIEGPTFNLEASRLLLRYRLSPLFGKRLEVLELVVDQPAAHVTLPDTASSAAPDTVASILPRLLSGRPAGSWAIGVDEARLRDGTVDVLSGGRQRYTLSGLNVAGRGSMDANGLAVDVDTAGAAFVSMFADSAGSEFRSEGSMALKGSLRDGTLTLDTMALSSDLSAVSGGGRLTFVDDPVLWRDVNLDLSADPLDLRDLPVELPEPLQSQPEVYLALHAAGAPDSLVLVGDGRMLGGATTAEADVVVRRQGSVGVRGTMSVRGIDLAPWSPEGVDGTGGITADFSLDGLSPGSGYAVNGSVRYDPRSMDPVRLTRRPLLARFDVTGFLVEDSTSSALPVTAEADVALSAERPAVSLGTVSVETDGMTARWSGDLRLGDGRVQGAGRLAWAPELDVETSGVTFTDLDLAVVDTIYPATALTGRLEGRLRREATLRGEAPLQGESPLALSGVADLQLAPSRYTDVSIDTVSLTSVIEGQGAVGMLFALTDLGGVQSRYSLELADSVVRFEADSLALFRPGTEETEGGEAHGRASGSWTLSEVLAGDVLAVVDSARWGAYSFDDGRIDARLRGERVEGEAELNVAGLLPTPLRVRGNADVVGLVPSTATGRVSLAVAHSSADSLARLDTLHVDVVANEPGRFALEGAIRPTEGGRIQLDGTAEAAGDSLSFDVVAAGSLGGPTALLGGATMDSLHLTASGLRVGEVWDAARGQLVLAEASWNRIESERALASVVFDSTGFRVDTLDVRSNVFTAFGQGRLPAGGSAGSIDVRGRVLDLDPLRELGNFDVLAAGDGTFQASFAGALDSLDFQADLDLEALVVNQLRMTGVRFTGEGVVAAPYGLLLGLSSSDMQLTFDRILLPDSEVRRVSFGASGGADSLRVEAEALVDGRRQASVLVHVDPRPEGRTARIEDLRFQIDEDQWRLVEEAIFQYREGLSVEPVLLRAGEQEIRVEGGVSEAGALDLNARMDSTDVATVADLVGLPRLRGWLSGRVRVQGTTDSPEAWLDIAGALHRQGRRPGPVALRVRGNGRRIRGDVELFDANQ
ncbi:MAG: hypothetical protein HKN73_02130, partial [Gemmatimonadetes bacterium]|nr:hypothetical protein [Gemmatimonadota bacterium]